MKKFNKGMVITGTIAAAIAAMTFTGCGKGTTEITKSESPKTVQAAANNAASENVTKSAEVTAEAKKEETKTTTKKDSKNTDKKTETKKKSSKKTEKTEAKGANATANVTVQPTVVVPQQNTQQAQDAKQTKAAETKAPVVIPDEVYPVWVEGDMYAGTYAEEIAGRGTMEITRNSDGTYSVQVDWSSSAFEKCSWTFSGEFDGRAVMHYDNCCKTTVAFDENGNYTCDSYGYMTPYNNYTNGSGYIEFKDEGVLEWHSNMGDILPETTFVSCKQPYNTKADEVGTAGSNYYANERAWEATGDFYEVSGKRLRLEISESNMGSGLYDVTVIASGSAFECETYGFLAHYENDALVYDRGARSYQCYDSNGNIVENTIIDEGHSGTITYTGAAGLRWTDSDGSNYVFMEDITCA